MSGATLFDVTQGKKNNKILSKKPIRKLLFYGYKELKLQKTKRFFCVCVSRKVLVFYYRAYFFFFWYKISPLFFPPFRHIYKYIYYYAWCIFSL